MEKIDEYIELSRGESFENCLREAIDRLKETLKEHMSQKVLQKTKETLRRVFPECVEFTESIESIDDDTEETELHNDINYNVYANYCGIKFYFHRTFHGSSDHKYKDENLALAVVCSDHNEYFVIREHGILISDNSETFMKILNYMGIPAKVLTKYIRILLACPELIE